MQQSRPRPDKPKRKRRSVNKTKLLLPLLLAVIAGLLVFVVAFLPRESAPPVRLPKLTTTSGPQNTFHTAPTSPSARSSGSSEQGPQPVVSRPAAFRGTVPRGKLIFIIDDVGNDLNELLPFLRFPGPLTLSIMPQRRYTEEAYRLILRAGKVPILHQPMEADGNENPGAGAIYTSMSKEEVDSMLARNLAGMDQIHWMNNHMGSKATSNINTMTYVLGYLKSRGIHFLDSRTTKDTVVKKVSLRLGLPYYRRNSYFLDNDVDKADIVKEIDKGLNVAGRQGYAVMIGHVWDRDLAKLLIGLYPQLVAEGYQFADIKSLPKEVSPDAGTGS